MSSSILFNKGKNSRFAMNMSRLVFRTQNPTDDVGPRWVSGRGTRIELEHEDNFMDSSTTAHKTETILLHEIGSKDSAHQCYVSCPIRYKLSQAGKNQKTANYY